MKRRFTILTAAITLLTILAFPMGMMGQTRAEYEFNLNQLYQNGTLVTAKTVISTNGGTLEFTDQDENFTILMTRNSSNQPGFYTSSGYIRFYNSDTFKLSAADGITMTKIVVTPYNSTFNLSAMTGLNTSTKTWEGSASEVTFTGSGTNKWDILTITYTTSGSSATPTTVTIDATGITNTDVYTSTAAGSMSATVTANNTPVSGATVTWASSNTGVATIDADGVVTLVAAGTTTISASYAGNEQYDSSSNTYELVVTDSTPFTGGDVTFVGGTDQGSSTNSNDGDEITKQTVTISSTKAAFGYSEYRIYTGSTTTISTTYGVITQIAFTKTGNYSLSNLSTQTGYDSETGIWTGNATSVSFSASAQVRLSQIVVTVAAPAAVATPTFSPEAGTYFETQSVTLSCESPNAVIFYTIDGTEPTSTSTQYNGAITVAETTTINAIAYVGTDHSYVATAIYTIEQPLSTIQAIFDAATTTATTHRINFNNWVITGANTSSHAFLSDGTNGCMIYESGHGFAAGDILSGIVECNIQKYNGALELTGLNSNTTGLTVTSGGTVTVANIAMADLAAINTGALVSYQNLKCSVTTSGNYTNYYLKDEATDTQIQAYTTLYSDLASSLEDGKTYNITGIFVQNNNTKRINPRSAADIEEVQVQHNEYTLTTSNLSHVDLYIFDAADQNTPIISGSGSAQVYDGTEVMISVDVETGYVIESLYVDGVDVTDQIDAADTYTFTMPTNNVTVTATAVEYVAPSGSNYVRISNLDQLTDGCKVVIAARHNSTVNSYYAMKNTANGKPVGTNFSSVTVNGNETLQSIIADDENDYYWTVNVTTDGYTFTNANDVLIGYNSGTNFAAGGNYTTWTIERSTSEATAMVGEYTGFVIKNFNTNARAFAFNGSAFGAYATSNLNGSGYNFFLDFFVQETSPVTETYTLDITGYGNNDGGYYLIASPVAEVTPSTENGFITDAFDLYWFDQTQEKEWKNYKVGQGFDLVNGMGYLYASQDNTTLTFVGTPYDGDGSVSLVKDDEAQFAGWNLVGNPFADSAYIDRDFYIMNPQTGKDLIQSNGVIAAMQGIFVSANEDGESLTFSTEPYRNNGKGLVMNVTGNRGNVIDRAVVRFGESRNLRKFQLFENSTRISISQDNSDYAVVRSDAQGEMPVNFKASENGTYTLSFNTENVEMDYLHLIDNMTGADIDLIANPSYSFEANTSDYTSRFRLVFAAGNNEMGNSFAFVSNGQIIVNGQGTVEVYDLTGRLISRNNDVTSIATDDMSAGVYMIRLTNGSSTKTQKIVVK